MFINISSVANIYKHILYYLVGNTRYYLLVLPSRNTRTGKIVKMWFYKIKILKYLTRYTKKSI